MPLMVLGEDGREIHENLSDMDAHALAQNVHAATGETVTLIPWIEKDGEYVLDKAGARTFPAGGDSVEAAEKPQDDIWKMSGKDLDALAATHAIKGYKKSAKVDDKRKMLANLLSPASA